MTVLLAGRPVFDSRQKLRYSIQIDTVAHQASYPMDTVGFFNGGKTAGA
jgi:hypothetical protein